MSQTPTSSDFQYTAPPSKGMAIAGLVCALLGCIPGIGIIGAILGIIAMNKAKSDPQRFGGAGIGLAAAIVGGVMTGSGLRRLHWRAPTGLWPRLGTRPEGSRAVRKCKPSPAV